MACAVLNKKLYVGDSLGAFLNLVKKNERLAPYEAFSRKRGQLFENVVFIFYILENPLCRWT